MPSFRKVRTAYEIRAQRDLLGWIVLYPLMVYVERQVGARRIRRFPLRADILMPWQRFVEGNSLMAEILEDHIRHTLLIRNAVGIRQEEFMGDLISLMLT
jgi:hypothetical protein